MRSSVQLLTMAFAAVVLCESTGFAQFAGGGQGQGGNQGNNLGGIAIDAAGVVTPAFAKETTAKLNQKRQEALAAEYLPGDVNVSSPLRKVSLVRLERASLEFAEQNKHVPVEMQFLAGLQRIDYVFVYPETGDLVIAGPAEGFAPNAIGRVLGTSTGRPPLRLDDLIVALRTVPRAELIGCSIDPTQQGLARFNDYLTRNSFATTTAVIQQRFREMALAMGTQDVSVFGVPANSHFASVLVEADYRMKLVGLGLEEGVLGVPSYLSGVRVGAAVAPIGAVVGEWVGSSAGLGYLMLHANARMQVDFMFAALALLAGFGLLLYFAVDAGLRRLTYWQREQSPFDD